MSKVILVWVSFNLYLFLDIYDNFFFEIVQSLNIRLWCNIMFKKKSHNAVTFNYIQSQNSLPDFYIDFKDYSIRIRVVFPHFFIRNWLFSRWFKCNFNKKFKKLKYFLLKMNKKNNMTQHTSFFMLWSLFSL